MAQRRMMSERMIGIAPAVGMVAAGGMVALLIPIGWVSAVVMLASLVAAVLVTTTRNRRR